MPRGTTLGEAITQLRHELAQSPDPALGRHNKAALVYRIRKAQLRLADKEDWPFMRVDHYIRLQDGLRFYDFPANLPFENVETARLWWSDWWYPLQFGISREQLNAYNRGEEYEPTMQWAPYQPSGGGTLQIEVWPEPVTDGYFYSDQPVATAYTDGTAVTGNNVLHFAGRRTPNALVDDDDRLDLDDDLVVLFAAAATAASAQSQKALEFFLAQASDRMSTLAGRQRKTLVSKMTTGDTSSRISPEAKIQAMVLGG